MSSSFFKSSWVLATQWDKESLQFVLAKKHGTKLSVAEARSFEHAGNIDFLSELMAAELKKHGARRPTVLVALVRSQVDMFTLSLPPATDDELAILVRLQTVQQAPEIGEDAELDFLPLDDDPSGPRSVLTVVPHPGVLEETRKTLQAAGVTLSQASFRPLATLPLARRLTAQTQHRALTVALHDKEADILLVEGSQPVLTRSVRLPDRDDLLFVASLSSEIHRTEIAAPRSRHLPEDSSASPEFDSPAAGRIESIYCFGGSDEQATWDALSNELGRPIKPVDPFQYLPLRENLSLRESGRFAPLVGMLHDYLEGDTTLDFLHPRRPAKMPSMLRRYAMLAVAAVALIGLAGFAVYEKRQTLTEELESLRGQVAQVDRMSEKIDRRQRIVSSVNAWQADDVNWLDELRDLSLRFPGPADAVVERMAVAPAAGGGNIVNLQVRVRDPAVVSMMEANLRDEYHSIRSKRVSELSGQDDFGWQFDASILVSPRQADAYRSFLALEKKPED